MNKYILSVLLALLSLVASAQIRLSDSAKISILTASPWSGAAYALYGHTAILVQDDSTGVDAVFNYGFFDLNQPNFMYNFMRGKTDYVLGVNSLEQFFTEYRMKGSEVISQELNLPADEKNELWNALYINALPENRGYRYNYFFDNCVTRPRDLVEKYTKGEIKYPADTQTQTFRDLIHECVHTYPWMEFGIDLVIGSGADKPISLREKMFLPAYYMNALDRATVLVNDTLSYPIVKDKRVVLQAVSSPEPDALQSFPRPAVAAVALLLLAILVSAFQLMKHNRALLPKIFDTVVFAVAGVGGFIIFFLMFFSEHPATSPNWNFVWLNVFALVFVILFWVKSLRNAVIIYHFINFAVLSLFLLLWWLIPQQLPVATIPFAMVLWIRSGVNVRAVRQSRLRKQQFTTFKQMRAGWRR